MPVIPGTFYRMTKHKKPQHQFYVPGFNPANSCWLDGDWVAVTAEEYETGHKAHQRLFKRCRKEKNKGHWRDPETKLTMMTEAQRRAYEHYSGQSRFDVRYENGHVGPVHINMAGNKPAKGQAKWMRGQGMKIIRFVTTTGKTVDSLEGLEFPEDLIHEGTTPIDPWEKVVSQNVQNLVDTFYGCLEQAVDEGAAPFVIGASIQMAVQFLIMKEESIIRTKWNAQVGRDEKYDDLDRDIREYAGMRPKAEEVLGEHFAIQYDKQKKTHNECARHNLGDHGQLFSFVLPTFNTDGTHEPWGPRDVPWGAV